MKKLVTRLISLTLALMLALSLTATVSSAEISGEYHWIAAMTVADTTINYMIVNQFKQLIEERSAGKITLDVYPSGQLGGDNEMFQGCRDGSIDIITSMTSGMVDFVPQAAVFDLPNLFPNVEAMRATLSGEFMDVMNTYNKAGGLMVLGYSDAGFRQLTSSRPIHSVADIAGIKLRTMNNKYHMAYWQSLGANPLPMDFNEVYMGLQQKTIDGEENPYMNIVGNSFQEVQDYIVETNHLGHIIIVCMNNDLYDGLPEDVRALVDECMAEAVQYGNSKADESIAEYKKICEDAGCEIVTLSPEDLALMQEKAVGIYDMIRKDLGDELVDKLLAAVKENS